MKHLLILASLFLYSCNAMQEHEECRIDIEDQEDSACLAEVIPSEDKDLSKKVDNFFKEYPELHPRFLQLGKESIFNEYFKYLENSFYEDENVEFWKKLQIFKAYFNVERKKHKHCLTPDKSNDVHILYFAEKVFIDDLLSQGKIFQEHSYQSKVKYQVQTISTYSGRILCGLGMLATCGGIIMTGAAVLGVPLYTTSAGAGLTTYAIGLCTACQGGACYDQLYDRCLEKCCMNNFKDSQAQKIAMINRLYYNPRILLVDWQR